jgi:hypothetical protein
VIRNGLGFRVSFDPAALEAPGATYVYCLTDGEYIKVGKTTTHPTRRLHDLNVGHPLELRLVGWTLGITERTAHRLLAPARVRAEWFAITPLTLHFIGALDWCDPALYRSLLQGGGPGGRIA